MTLYTQQSKNIWRTWLLMSLFFVIVILLGFVFSYIYDSAAILYIAVAISVGMNIMSYWYSDTIVLKTSAAIPADKSRYEDLYQVTENLAITAGLPMPRLYVVNDPAPNAFATGRDKNHATIAVTSGLLAILNRNELEGVISHELSHIGNRDTLLQTVVVVLVGFIALLSNFFLRLGALGVRGGRRNGNQVQVVAYIIGIVFAVLSPIAAVLIQLAISRKREFLADASGALLTRYPEGLASALGKISSYNGHVAHASNATAHLYISDPFADKPQKKKSGLSKLFMTHPPVEERIAALLGQNQ